MKNLIYILLFLTQAAFAQSFKEGNEYYRKGKYAEAVQSYENILKEKKESAEVFFNLGNAYYKLGKIAPAIYNFEKALQLDPNNADIQTNLGFAQRMAIDDIKAAPKTGISKMLYNRAGTYHYDTWAWAAVALAVGSLLFFIGYYLSGTTLLKRIFFIAMCLAIVLMVISIIFGFFVRSQASKDRPAIVFAEVVSGKAEPNSASPDAFLLHEGTKVNVIDSLDNWKKIELADDTTGWIEKDAIKELK